MSLRDTIEGARREAQDNMPSLPKKRDDAQRGAEEEHKGFARSSAAKARPAREAASSVRMESKPKANDAFGGRQETKEERKERKRKEREREDFRNRAFELVLRSLPGYRKTEKVFWAILGAGLVLAVISLVFAYVFGSNSDLSTWQGVVSVASLVLAYVFIIGGFIFDLVRRRPFRKEAEKRVRGLSDKKLLELFERGGLPEQEAAGSKKRGKKK